MAKVILEDADYEDVHMVIHDWMGLDLTREQIKTFLKNEYHITCEIAEFGATDTCVREAIMEALGERITGKPYYDIPGSSKEERKAYWDLFDQKAREYGFKVVEEQK